MRAYVCVLLLLGLLGLGHAVPVAKVPARFASSNAAVRLGDGECQTAWVKAGGKVTDVDQGCDTCVGIDRGFIKNLFVKCMYCYDTSGDKKCFSTSTSSKSECNEWITTESDCHIVDDPSRTLTRKQISDLAKKVPAQGTLYGGVPKDLACWNWALAGRVQPAQVAIPGEITSKILGYPDEDGDTKAKSFIEDEDNALDFATVKEKWSEKLKITMESGFAGTDEYEELANNPDRSVDGMDGLAKLATAANGLTISKVKTNYCLCAHFGYGEVPMFHHAWIMIRTAKLEQLPAPSALPRGAEYSPQLPDAGDIVIETWPNQVIMMTRKTQNFGDRAYPADHAHQQFNHRYTCWYLKDLNVAHINMITDIIGTGKKYEESISI